MSLTPNKHDLVKLLSIGVIIHIISCGTASKIVYQSKATESKVKYYVTENPDYRKGESKFYARVDSGNVRIFYNFQLNNIYKTYDNSRNYVYSLVFDKQPMLQLTLIDSILLKKADNLLDSLGYKDLKRAKAATGFVVEVARY